MKILKDNYNKIIEEIKNDIEQAKIKPYPRKILCENCESELEYEEPDVVIGNYGLCYVNCPLCDYDNYLDACEKEIVLTVDNIEFPVHFNHTSKETGAVDCCNNEMVKEYVRKAINYFRENKEEFDWGGHITGNFYINVHRYEGDEDYEVTVSNDFYDTYVPFESEDY